MWKYIDCAHTRTNCELCNSGLEVFFFKCVNAITPCILYVPRSRRAVAPSTELGTRRTWKWPTAGGLRSGRRDTSTTSPWRWRTSSFSSSWGREVTLSSGTPSTTGEREREREREADRVRGADKACCDRGFYCTFFACVVLMTRVTIGALYLFCVRGGDACYDRLLLYLFCVRGADDACCYRLMYLCCVRGDIPPATIGTTYLFLA